MPDLKHTCSAAVANTLQALWSGSRCMAILAQLPHGLGVAAVVDVVGMLQTFKRVRASLSHLLADTGQTGLVH